MGERQYLVIVRAGDRSLHPSWLSGPGERSWDLVVNYYGDDAAAYRHDDVQRIDSKGPKWPALHDLLQAHPDLAKRYRYVWLPDDDLATDMQTINHLFAFCDERQLEAAQPTLSWDSYSSHLITLRHANSVMRYTNFVEVMAPCLSAGMLAKTMPFFADNLSGWGLDFVWSKYADNADTGVGIIDEVTVRHTRPVGGPNYKALEEKGVTPLNELKDFCEMHDIDPTMVEHKALDRQGRVLQADNRERWFAARLLLGCLPAVRHAPDWKRVSQRLARFAWQSAAYGRTPSLRAEYLEQEQQQAVRRRVGAKAR